MRPSASSSATLPRRAAAAARGEHALQRLRDRDQRLIASCVPPARQGPTCRRASRSAGRPRCACRGRPPWPCRRSVRQATETAVSASISTPVGPTLARLGAHAEAGQRVVGRDVDADLGQRQRMAERDQFVGALGRHDAGDARGAEDVALLGVAGEDQLERRRAAWRRGPRRPRRARSRPCRRRRPYGPRPQASMMGEVAQRGSRRASDRQRRSAARASPRRRRPGASALSPTRNARTPALASRRQIGVRRRCRSRRPRSGPPGSAAPAAR